jgi:hypothetical protein
MNQIVDISVKLADQPVPSSYGHLGAADFSHTLMRLFKELYVMNC